MSELARAAARPHQPDGTHAAGPQRELTLLAELGRRLGQIKRYARPLGTSGPGVPA
jgi:hypothetical protein